MAALLTTRQKSRAGVTHRHEPVVGPSRPALGMQQSKRVKQRVAAVDDEVSEHDRRAS